MKFFVYKKKYNFKVKCNCILFIDRIKIFIFLLIFGKKSSYYIVFGYSVSVNNVNYMLFIGF